MIFSPNDRSWINWATFLFGETKPGFWSISPNNIYLYPFFKIKNRSVWFLFYINLTFIFIFRIPWINSELRCLEPDSSSIPTWSELRVHDSTLLLPSVVQQIQFHRNWLASRHWVFGPEPNFVTAYNPNSKCLGQGPSSL